MMKRRSVRGFKDQEIPESVIEQLIDMANNAPSRENIQPIPIILVQGGERRAKLDELVGDQPWIRHAPLTMIFCLGFYRIKKWAEMCRTEFRGE